MPPKSDTTLRDDLMTLETIVESPLQTETREQQTYQPLLRDNVQIALTNYLANVGDEPVTNLYQMVLKEVEEPLLEAVMNYVRGNQTQAAKVLGLNRGTLRKKLGLMD